MTPPQPRATAAALRVLGALVLLVLIAALVPSAPLRAQESSAPDRQSSTPIVTDPMPAPGAVLAPGPQVLAARVEGAAPSAVRFLVDGERVSGQFADPDGQLSTRWGVDATLEPGAHVVAVEVVGVGVVREWPVLVTGLAIDVAEADLTELGLRTSGRRAIPRPVLLVNPAAVEESLTAAPLAVATDALLLPTEADAVPASTLEAMAQAGVEPGAEVLLLGGPDVIGTSVEESLGIHGYLTVRIGDGGPDAVAAAAAAYMGADGAEGRVPGRRPGAAVVAPTQPLVEALRAAITAASTGAALFLVGPAGLIPATAERLKTMTTVLLSTSLSPEHRQGVVNVLAAGAVYSDDAMSPRRASDVLIIGDDDPAVALLAGRAAGPTRAVVIGAQAGRDFVTQYQPDRVTVVGQTGTDPNPDRPISDATVEDLMRDLRQDWANGADAPDVEVLIDPTAGLSITFTSPEELSAAAVHVNLLGYEWPGVVEVSGTQAQWHATARPRLPESLEPATPQTAARVDVTATVTGQTGSRHIRAVGRAVIDPQTSRSRDGFVVAGGTSRVVGRGPLKTFTVEVEQGTGLDILAVASEIEQILLDPRGWTADGTRSLQRVGNAAAADLRVVVARPSTVDFYCGRVGLRTGGRVSCWDGYRALLNLDRWNTGVVPFHTDLVVYRAYLASHEFGHGLGYGHEFCPGPGAIAPVMQQQTGGIGSCQANGWPYPEVGSRVAVPPPGAGPS